MFTYSHFHIYTSAQRPKTHRSGAWTSGEMAGAGNVSGISRLNNRARMQAERDCTDALRPPQLKP